MAEDKPEKNYHPMSALQKTAWGGAIILMLVIAIPAYTVWLKYEDKRDSDAKERQKEIEQNIAIRERIIDLESFQKEVLGDVDRLDSRVTENTDWRVAQERRATERIKDQGYREERLSALEDEYESHISEHVDSLKSANSRMESRIRELGREIEKLKEAKDAL